MPRPSSQQCEGMEEGVSGRVSAYSDLWQVPSDSLDEDMDSIVQVSLNYDTPGRQTSRITEEEKSLRTPRLKIGHMVDTRSDNRVQFLS